MVNNLRSDGIYTVRPLALLAVSSFLLLRLPLTSQLQLLSFLTPPILLSPLSLLTVAAPLILPPPLLPSTLRRSRHSRPKKQILLDSDSDTVVVVVDCRGSLLIVALLVYSSLF